MIAASCAGGAKVRAIAMLIVVAVVAAACGASEPESEGRGGLTPLAVETPATIVGELEVSVEEGPVGDDDLSEVNFGSVTTDDGIVLIEVWADEVRAAGLSRDELVGGGRYRVELGGESEYSDAEYPSYVVIALQPDG